VDEIRVAQIRRYGLAPSPPRADLVELVEVAALVAGVPMATVNVITAAEQWQVAATGFEAAMCQREDSMCTLVLEGGTPVVVPDASRDERLRDNPFVTGKLGHVRFYASFPLRTPTDVVIGTLCVYDTVPGSLSPAQERALASLADRVVDQLELEMRTRALSGYVEELHQRQAELVASNDRLAAFAGQVSHDLRNPLAAVTTLLQALARDHGSLPPASRMLLRRALDGTARMSRLIEELLAFARLGGRLTRERVDLNAVVAEVFDDLADDLSHASVTAGKLPVVWGDAVQLRAVIQNLLGNAVKFTRPAERPTIEVTGGWTGDCWRVEVTDRGPGVPAELRERMFEPLARCDESVEGSGIGLATCRRVIQAHGGRIGLDDAPEGGTCAWFELPA
jgi:signal transduction histidine kinase